jgi:hypothetical protein
MGPQNDFGASRLPTQDASRWTARRKREIDVVTVEAKPVMSYAH